MSDTAKKDDKGDSKMATVVKHLDGEVMQELITRANAKKGYPWVGLAATGCMHVGAGPHVADNLVRTESVSTVFLDEGTGEQCAFVTPDVVADIDEVIAEAAAKVQAGQGNAKDVEIAGLTKTEKDP